MKYIYYLIDPNTKEVKYVGQSSDPKKRARQHILQAKKKGKSPKDLWINSLVAVGNFPSLEVAEKISDATTKESAYLAEQRHQVMHIDTILNQLIAGEGQFSTVEFYRRNGRIRRKAEKKEKPENSKIRKGNGKKNGCKSVK